MIVKDTRKGSELSAQQCVLRVQSARKHTSGPAAPQCASGCGCRCYLQEEEIQVQSHRFWSQGVHGQQESEFCTSVC